MTPTPGTPGQEPIGLSERLKQIQAHQDGALPAFDLDAVVRGGRRRRARRTAAGVVTAVASVAAVAALVTVPLTRHTTTPTPPATKAPAPSPLPTKRSVPVGKFKGVDLRYEQDGSFINHDYLRQSSSPYRGLGSQLSGVLGVYKPGGVTATTSSPLLASVDVSIVRHGSVGTVRLTITASQAVTFSPSDFTWLAPSIEAGPTATADVSVPAGKHTETMTFDGVSQGALSWSLAPTWDFYWATD